MGESLKYIYDFLNRKSATLSFYVTRINQVYDSKNNRSLELTGYVTRIIELINEVKQIMEKMNVSVLPVNSFCNQLKLLKPYGIPEVEEFLDLCKYEDTFNNSVNDAINSIEQDESINEESKLLIEYLLNYHMIPKESQTIVYEYYIRRALLKQKLLSYETFENVIVDWTKLQMGEYVESPECQIVSEEEIDAKLGYAFQNTIYLNKNDVQEMFNTGFFRLLKTIFHEMVHVMQYKLVKIDGNSSPLLIKEIEDEILAHLIPEYYEDNYERLSYEAEAEFIGIYYLLKLFAKFGIQFQKGINPYIKTLQNLEKIINNDTRIIENEEITLSELFEYKITNFPEYLELYPQLKEKFHIAFGDIVIANDEYGSR